MVRGGPESNSAYAVLYCGFLFLLISIAAGQAQQIDSNAGAAGTSATVAHPVLVELFTSEGCSSCPPADALLQRLDSAQPVAHAQLIVLSEHVDYWDHDGWKDPYSSAALTERQRQYTRVLKLETPYTPQIIVDGSSELQPDKPQQVGKVFHEAAAAVKMPVRISEVSVDRRNPAVLLVHIEVDGRSDKDEQPADIYVATALDHAESQVSHGENSGRHLTHVAVVLQLTKIGQLEKGKSFGETVQLKLKPGTDAKDVRIVAFVQAVESGKLLGAALRKPAN